MFLNISVFQGLKNFNFFLLHFLHLCSIHSSLTGKSIHDLAWSDPLGHTERQEHCTMLGSSSLVYADTCSLCRSFQSSDRVAPSPSSKARHLFIALQWTSCRKFMLTLNWNYALIPLPRHKPNNTMQSGPSKTCEPLCLENNCWNVCVWITVYYLIKLW